MMNLPILKRAAGAYEAAMRTGRCDNKGLVFDRYAPFLDTKNNKEAKRDGLRAIALVKQDAELHRANVDRWHARVTALGAESMADLATDARLVTGVGRRSPFEVGFNFDRHGFVSLPGTGLKGLARSFALVELARALKIKKAVRGSSTKTPLGDLERLLLLDDAQHNATGEDRAEKWPDAFERAYHETVSPEAREMAGQFRAVFGNTDQAGGVIFLDAIALDLPVVELDILNPHYPEYYRGTGVAHNAQSPIPVYFLALKRGVRFGFAFARRAGADDGLVAVARDWLRRALIDMGFGAKTSAGYGSFWVPVAEPRAVAGAGVGNMPQSAPPAAQGIQRTEIGVLQYDKKGKPKIKFDTFLGPRSMKDDHKWADFGIKNTPPGGARLEVTYIEMPDKSLVYKSIRVL